MNYFRAELNKIRFVLSKNGPISAAIRGGFLMSAGDAISQIVIEERKTLDPVRIVRFGIIGFCAGPILHRWYFTLEKICHRPLLQNTGFLGKVGIDQLAFQPIFVFGLLTSNQMLQGESFSSTFTNVSKSYGTVMLNNYKLWPIAQVINFGLVPIQYRVAFSQVVALFWNCYLAWETNQSNDKNSDTI